MGHPFDHPTEIELYEKFPKKFEEIQEELCEMLWDRDRKSSYEEGEDGHVYVADIVMINACNHIISGSFWLGGVEYSYEYECGDINGAVWRELSADAPIKDIDYRPPVWALQPKGSLVNQRIADGKAKLLLGIWDAFLEREEYKTLPGKYGYDRMFAPGLKTERYWADQAAKVGFVIVDEDTAKETRKRLEESCKETA